MNPYADCIVIIPVYNPTEAFIPLVKDLFAEGFSTIVCINDGSSTSELFHEAAKLGCHVLTHAVNLGKGRALKTAMNYCLNELGSFKSVVTVDGDGQHSVSSIKACVDMMNSHIDENAIVLGNRIFADTDDTKIPLKSKLGNIITCNVLTYLCDIKIHDTQTGLRCIPMSLIPDFILIEGERYEYETNMILHCHEQKIQFYEVPIQTIYEEKNISSHFSPIKDSIKIYKTIFLYSLTSFLSVIIDYLGFLLLLYITNNVWITTYGARIVSSIFNFTMNRHLVFRAKNHLLTQAVKYFLLVLLSCSISATAIHFVTLYTIIPAIVVKAVVDILLYFFNFMMQKTFVFKKNND